MKLFFLSAASCLLLLHATPVESAPTGSPTKRVVGYLPNWGSLNVKDVPGDKLTHLMYAFANIDAKDGIVVPGDVTIDTSKSYDPSDKCACCARGKYNQMFQFKKTYPHLRTILSIGGASWSRNFAAVSATEASRQKFVASGIKIMSSYGFDGLDIDWEFPSNAQQADNFLQLVREFRTQLNAIPGTKRHELTYAIGTDDDLLKRLDIRELSKSLDFYNIMTYDMSLGFETSRHQSGLHRSVGDPDSWARSRYFGDKIVSTMLAAGASASQLVLGIPIYGYSTVVALTGPGGAPVKTVAGKPGLFQKQACGADCQKTVNYDDIVSGKVGKGSTRFFDQDADVPYRYNPTTGLFITYDDVQSVILKTEFVNEKDLGGVMFWSIDTDTQDPKTSLVYNAWDRLEGKPTIKPPQSSLCSSLSTFCNIKCSN